MSTRPSPGPDAAALLVVEGLVYRYQGASEPALRGVSLRIERGESVGLVGPNGAGKSTLLLHLNGTLLGRGRVVVDGIEVSSRSLAAVRGRVGLAFQDPDDQLFMPTVAEDVAFGPIHQDLGPAAVRRRVEEALAAVGLPGFEARAPHHLSGGEKRAVALATVLAMRPEILVLDEPTSGLDPRGRRRLRELLAASATTRLLATHDLELVLATCERCILFDEGRVVADGPSRTLLADRALMERHGLEVPASLAAVQALALGDVTAAG